VISKEGAAGAPGWRHKTATHRRILRGRRSMAVTSLTIHDNVILRRFPSPIFFSKAFSFQHKRQRVAWVKLTKMVVISCLCKGAQ
jgi:hypothetical protein